MHKAILFNIQQIDQMPISFEEAIEILERESRSGSTSSLSTPPDSSYVNPTQNRSAEVMENVSQQEIDSLVQNISQLSGVRPFVFIFYNVLDM